MNKLAKKPCLRNDLLLKVINNAPKYQPIPVELFKENHRKEYLNWRNEHLSRPNVDRDKFINLSGKSVLDLGCEIGYFGWNNARIVKLYLGIDSDPNCINAGQLITTELRYRNIHFINADLVDFIKDLKVHYDICLFFSIYHHLMYEIGIEEARKVINKVSKICDELYFDMGQKSEHSNKARRKWHCLLPNEEPKIFIQREVLINTLFKKSKILGETRVEKSKRLLFRFTK